MAWTAPRTWVSSEVVTAAIMNTHIRDNLLAIGAHAFVRKTVSEDVTSLASPQADDELFLAIGANETWAFRAYLAITGSSAGDIQIGFKIPSGTLTWSGCPTWNASDAFVATPTIAADSYQNYGVLDTTNKRGIHIVGLVRNGATAGSLALWWGQAASNATATRVWADSWLFAVREA